MDNEKEKPGRPGVGELADFILDAGIFLMASGAHSGRVWRNCKRMTERWGYQMNINPTFTGMMVSIWDADNSDNTVTRYKTSPGSVVHLGILTLISHLSWEVADGKATFDKARSELEAIKQNLHYPFWLVALVCGFSCGCLCTLAGGDMTDALIAFSGAAAGYFTRYFFVKKHFNQFLSFIIASFVTSLIAGLDTVFGLGRMPEMTLATSVLYLIPGVPLINSVIDLLEGYFHASIARSLFAASVLLCIAVGMALSIFMLGINNF